MRGNVSRQSARRPTMKEVARVAGREPGDRLPGHQRHRRRARRTWPSACRHAVKLLGYRRDLTASTLRRADRQSASIGLIIEDVSNPFFSAVHRGVEDVARPRGVLTFVGSSRRGARAASASWPRRSPRAASTAW